MSEAPVTSQNSAQSSAISRIQIRLASLEAESRAKGIGWEVLLGPVLEAAIAAVSNCIRSKSQLASGMANPSPLEKVALRQAVRREMQEQGIKATPQAINAAVEAALTVSRDSSPEQRGEFINMVSAYATDNSPV